MLLVEQHKLLNLNYGFISSVAFAMIQSLSGAQPGYFWNVQNVRHLIVRIIQETIKASSMNQNKPFLPYKRQKKRGKSVIQGVFSGKVIVGALPEWTLSPPKPTQQFGFPTFQAFTAGGPLGRAEGEVEFWWKENWRRKGRYVSLRQEAILRYMYCAVWGRY